MDRLLKVATPPLALTLVVPLNTPAPGLLPRPRVTTVELSPVTRLLKASSSWTLTAGLMLAPACVLFGDVANARWVTAAGVIAKVLEVAPVRVPEAAVSV